MSKVSSITTLFLDIGGVLLNNGWDRQMRRLAAQHFDLDYEELNERHHLIFDSYEKGQLSLEAYLERIVFYRQRSFSPEEFRAFMYAQSQACPEMIELIRRLKARYQLKIVAVSNEGRELNAHRIENFGLTAVIDFFVSSCYVHLRKPDPEIFRMAIDMAQVNPGQVIYIDDREMFIDVAQSLEIRGILHRDVKTTGAELARLGLTLN
ncbi:HAD family hydrolase [Geopsychrobacter electrodiphilus]|uniref:HAD family hydrolase n=1 Tax=Geopsychrobacter electrodiphilus TaxID=225196 RepID=UPI0003692E36|nr:HAD family phosphatase [Geopsychrobacter electrodiphilus]